MNFKYRLYIISIILLVVLIAMLLAPIGKPTVSNKQYDIYVVYSPSCPHCENLLEFLDNNGINVTKITIDEFANTSIFPNLTKYFVGVPFVFAEVNDSLVVVIGYPSKTQEKDGYLIGRDYEENMCIKVNGTPVYINNTYQFCNITGVLVGNKYSIMWLIDQCEKYGCKKLI